jgi:hypothetical protein
MGMEVDMVDTEELDPEEEEVDIIQVEVIHPKIEVKPIHPMIWLNSVDRLVMVMVGEEEEEGWQTTHTTSIKRVCILNWLNSNNSILPLYNKLDKGERRSLFMVVLPDLMVRLMVRTTSPRMVHTVH